ncbi:MAG TPA: hypothetical protein EYO73_11940 [Sulfurimonas sp.]|nr:hypothetical protein [Sulfurimonas sp.]
MQREIKERLEEVVELLNDPDEVVLDKEVEAKLEKVLTLLRNPQEVVQTKNHLKERMQEIVGLVNSSIIDIDVDVEYCIPGAVPMSQNCDILSTPHILLRYSEDEYTTRTRKVSLGKTALQSSPEDFTKHVVLAIEEFKDEMDDIQMG